MGAVINGSPLTFLNFIIFFIFITSQTISFIKNRKGVLF